MKQAHEIYWEKKFRVSGPQLAGAVRALGKSTQKVGQYLVSGTKPLTGAFTVYRIEAQ